MRRTIQTISSLLLLLAVQIHSDSVALSFSGNISQLKPTRLVTIKPSVGYSHGAITVRLSKSETDMIAILQVLALEKNGEPTTSADVRWRIQSGSENSPTLLLAKETMTAPRELLARVGFPEPPTISIVVGRSQKYLEKQIESLGCSIPESKEVQALLMGATLCNRTVISINLTGYFFVTSVATLGNVALDTRPEPALNRTLYQIANRNITSLAHEWTHVEVVPIRNRNIASFEPAWLSEGMAEVVSGLARVRATHGKFTYLEFHVVRLRKFSNWVDTCRAPLSVYRMVTEDMSGCEYLRGAVACEMLIARFGGIHNVQRLYEDFEITRDFGQSFRTIYGMSMSDFEKRADKYARYIALVQ